MLGLGIGLFIFGLVVLVLSILVEEEGVAYAGFLIWIAGLVFILAFLPPSKGDTLKPACLQRGYHHVMRADDSEYYCYALPWEINGGTMIMAEDE